MIHATGYPRNASRTLSQTLAVLTVASLLSVRFFLFVDRYSVNIFFSDQWDILGKFFKGDPSIGELFWIQHGPHRQGMGLILNKFLYPLTAWSSRAESFMLAGSMVVAMLLALRLKVKLFGRLDYGDAIIPAIFLTLTQYENFIGPLNAAHSVFPLVMILLYGLALSLESPLLRYGLLLLLNFLLIYTGFGIFMGVITVGVFALAWYRQARRLESLPPVLPPAGLLIASLSLASFFIDYTFLPSADCFEFPYHKPWDYPSFMARMFGTATGIGKSVRTLTGMAVLSAVIFIFVNQALRAAHAKSRFNLHLTIAVLTGFSLLYSANAAVGRVCFGLAAAQASRYATLLIPAFLATYFYFRTIESKKIRNVAVALLALMLVRGIVHLDSGVKWLTEGKRNWANCYKQTEDIAYCDASTHFWVYPDPERTHLKQKLDYLKANHLSLFAD